MIKVMIVDDEQKARSVLQRYIQTLIPEVSEIRTAVSVQEAKELLGTYSPHLVFLDIDMPHENGFNLLLSITKPAFDVIFITGYNQYAIQAIRFNALDYLLKPIDPDELIKAVKRYLMKRQSEYQKGALFDNLAANIDKTKISDSRLAVPSSDGVFFFTLSEILRLEADRNYTVIYFKEKRPFVASKTLKYFEEILEPFRFVRTHKSHLVNFDHVVRISSSNEFIILSDGSRVEVSRRRKEEVLSQLNLR